MTLRLRVLLVAVVAVLVTLSGTTAALAYIAQSGFSATTYATLPSGTAAGVTFIGTTMYVVDPSSGNLYIVPAAGSISLAGTIPGGPTGLAYYGGSLYATRTTANDVVRIDPLTGDFTPITVPGDFAGFQLRAIAADASTGDLYVTTASGFGYVWVIHTPLTPTSPEPFFHLTADVPAYGISVAADHSVFVVVPTGSTSGVWRIASGAALRIATFSGGRGLGVIPGYVFVNDTDGSIQKLIIPGVGTGANRAALTGGAPGDLATIGTDGCFYASQGATVVRVANANGSCDLVNTTPPPPPPPTLTLTLTNESPFPAVAGDGLQTFNATVGNVASPGGISVTFTVTRGASITYTATTDATGTASFGYAAATAGTDVITASAVVNGTTLTSNPVAVTFIDRTGPTVSAAITPLPDANGNNALQATVNVTASDPSGIGSITYSAAGAQTIASTMVSVPGAPLTFTVPIPLSAIGDTTVTYSARDALGNVSATQTITVHILATQPTTLAITSSPTLTQGTPVTATLLAFGTAPVAGQTVTFTAGGMTATGTTDATGSASAVLNLAPGTYTLTATFGGTTAYVASSAGPQTLSVAGATHFVIWGGNPGGVQPGQRVIFWGEHWWDAVQLVEKLKVKEFKGWADSVNGTTWTSKGGDSKPPEAIPSYITVIVTTSVEKVDDNDRPKGDKSKVRGNIFAHAILRVDSPYKDDPGKSVYGVVVAVIP